VDNMISLISIPFHYIHRMTPDPPSFCVCVLSYSQIFFLCIIIIVRLANGSRLYTKSTLLFELLNLIPHIHDKFHLPQIIFRLQLSNLQEEDIE